MEQLKQQGVQYLDKLTETELSDILITANNNYYNNTTTISDNVYDIVKEFVEQKFPNNMAIKMIGAPVNKKKVHLPYKMPSMDKIKPDTGAMGRWLEKYKGDKVISGKLDGVSGLYSTEGGIPKLYTRGNGTVGQDISHIIPFLKLPMISDITLRGEFIIPKHIFEQKYTAANARSFVSGTINLKTPDPDKYKDIDFICYEVIKPCLKPSEQFSWLVENNIPTVTHKICSHISNELLSSLLQSVRTNYKYETDGLIVCNDQIYKRNGKNPKHAFAFKMILSDQMAEAKVLDVIWSPSKDGMLKPRVQFEPVTINGATLQFASGYNAKFIYENKIGIGSVIKIIRSGDVIPKIVTVMGNAEPKMPNIPWQWNETEVDAIMLDANNSEIVIEKTITRFFVKLEVDGLGLGNIRKLIKSGFDSISKILEMDVEDFLSCEGFQERKATKIYKNIKKQIKNCSLECLMAASNLMGRGMGERRSRMVLKEIPDILTSSLEEYEKIELVSNIEGFALKTAELFVKQIPTFLEFIEEIGLEKKLCSPSGVENKQSPLYGKSFVFSGVRPDKEMTLKLFKLTDKKITNSITKNTHMLIVKDETSTSSKIKKAKKMGIQIMNFQSFIKFIQNF